MPDNLDDFIPINESRALFPGRPHVATIWRWCLKGCRRGNHVVKLQYIRCGRRVYIRPEDIAQFINDLHSADDAAACAAPPPRPQVVRTSSRRRRDIERASAQLDAAGI